MAFGKVISEDTKKIQHGDKVWSCNIHEVRTKLGRKSPRAFCRRVRNIINIDPMYLTPEVLVEQNMYYSEHEGKTYYLRETRPPGGRRKKDQGFFCTMTPYTTSVYGQVESCGWFEKSEFKRVRNTKKMRQLAANIIKARQAGMWVRPEGEMEITWRDVNWDCYHKKQRNNIDRIFCRKQK